ncbi:MAG: cytochrome d ubiquinol oxidase subunit II [Bacteroidales bacterium]|nr:cytochrome d ubiquinol oxidase subunit II [Bacteroidales bacterium]
MSEVISLTFLQNYWWVIISILGSFLIFLMYIQGGQTLIYTIGKNEEELNLLINALGRKWELTFTTLVTFGGAFYASFPLFYATILSGAYWLWIITLIVFVLQAVSYEFRNKANNLLGKKTYEYFLFFNGLIASLFLGIIIGSFFTGNDFYINENNLPKWNNHLHGLENILCIENLIMGITLFFLSRTNGALFFVYSIDNTNIVKNSLKQTKINGLISCISFILFLILIFLRKGYEYNNDYIYLRENKYFLNFIEMPITLVFLLSGLFLLIYSILKTSGKNVDKLFLISGLATILLVFSLFLNLGFNNTCYFPSYADVKSSLNIRNSSSSYFTLSVLSIASLILPFVLWYIIRAWKLITKVSSSDTLENNDY